METEPALPPELISHILSLLPVDEQSTVTTLLACTRVSSSFAAVALHDSLWTPLARQRWKRGSPLTLPSHSYYKKRALLDAESRSTVLEMAGAGENRLPLVERVRAAGEDVIEVLSGTWDDPELHLTANYWATETRHGVYRDLAIATWKRCADPFHSNVEVWLISLLHPSAYNTPRSRRRTPSSEELTPLPLSAAPIQRRCAPLKCYDIQDTRKRTDYASADPYQLRYGSTRPAPRCGPNRPHWRCCTQTYRSRNLSLHARTRLTTSCGWRVPLH